MYLSRAVDVGFNNFKNSHGVVVLVILLSVSNCFTLSRVMVSSVAQGFAHVSFRSSAAINKQVHGESSYNSPSFLSVSNVFFIIARRSVESGSLLCDHTCPQA